MNFRETVSDDFWPRCWKDTFSLAKRGRKLPLQKCFSSNQLGEVHKVAWNKDTSLTIICRLIAIYISKTHPLKDALQIRWFAGENPPFFRMLIEEGRKKKHGIGKDQRISEASIAWRVSLVIGDTSYRSYWRFFEIRVRDSFWGIIWPKYTLVANVVTIISNSRSKLGHITPINRGRTKRNLPNKKQVQDSGEQPTYCRPQKLILEPKKEGVVLFLMGW